MQGIILLDAVNVATSGKTPKIFYLHSLVFFRGWLTSDLLFLYIIALSVRQRHSQGCNARVLYSLKNCLRHCLCCFCWINKKESRRASGSLKVENKQEAR